MFIAGAQKVLWVDLLLPESFGTVKQMFNRNPRRSFKREVLAATHLESILLFASIAAPQQKPSWLGQFQFE